MHLRTRIGMAAAVLASFAGIAQACPRHATKAQRTVTAIRTPAVSSPRTALVAWKPRAWSPSGSTQANGLWVSRDPVDGALGMPDAATLASQAVIAREGGADAAIQIERHADGSLSATLDDRFAEFAVAKIGSDGKPAWQCVPGRQGAAQFLARPVILAAPATVKREDK